MKNSFRYLKLYGYFVRFSMMRSMQFRFDFFFRILMDVLYYVVNIALYLVLYSTTDILGGWTREQGLVFVASFCVIDALQMTLFSNNMWSLPAAINKGDIDYYLVRPVNSLFFLALREFAVNSFVNLLIALGFLAWALSQIWGQIQPVSLFLFFILLLNGTFLHFALHYLTLVPVFWLQSPRGFEEFYWSFSRVMERPDRIFRGWVWRIFVSIIPYSLMASFPARIILDPLTGTERLGIFAYQIGVGLLFLGVVVYTWRRALRVYSSASS